MNPTITIEREKDQVELGFLRLENHETKIYIKRTIIAVIVWQEK